MSILYFDVKQIVSNFIFQLPLEMQSKITQYMRLDTQSQSDSEDSIANVATSGLYRVLPASDSPPPMCPFPPTAMVYSMRGLGKFLLSFNYVNVHIFPFLFLFVAFLFSYFWLSILFQSSWSAPHRWMWERTVCVEVLGALLVAPWVKSNCFGSRLSFWYRRCLFSLWGLLYLSDRYY